MPASTPVPAKTSAVLHPDPRVEARQIIPLVDLQRQTALLAPELSTAMNCVLERCDFILGSETARFEEAFAHYVGVPHAIGVASGLDALRLALVVIGLEPGDEVILPANTFIATALAVSSVGVRPVLIDCDRSTYNLDVAQLEALITPRTKAILPVHLMGQPADMDPILRIAQRHGLAVIEDACQAHGAIYHGRRCGSWGALGCFSFYPGKNLGACGDGGMITTSDAMLADRLRRLRNYGQEVKYRHVEQGLNSRLDTLQAAILNVKLKHLDQWNCARQELARLYRSLLSGQPDLAFQSRLPDTTHVYHLFVVETLQRDSLQAFLASRGIQTGIHYPIPIHLQPAYAPLGYSAGDFPVAEALARQMLSLPMFPELQVPQVQYVASAILEWRESVHHVDHDPR